MPDRLIQKYKDSYNTADFLLGMEKYGSVPHCAYYSIVQLMKYITIVKLQVDEQNIPRVNYHKWQINYIKDNLPKHYRMEFIDLIYELKNLRNKGDYDLELISYEDAMIAKANNEKVAFLLNKIFKVL